MCVFCSFLDLLPDNFMLVVDMTHKIYQVGLEIDDVRALDIDSIGNPRAITYNPFDTRLIWSDTKDGMNHSVFLNSSGHKILANTGK